MKRIISILFLLLPVCMASAQDGYRTAYFMDTYLYAHTMNPAFCPDRNYLGIATGRIGVQTQTNLGASTFFFPDGKGGMDGFYSDRVPAGDFLGKLRERNPENLDVNVDLINFGFRARNGWYHTFSTSLRVRENGTIPYDLFRFLKEGSTNGTDYDLSGLNVKARAYGQVAYGISLPLNDRLRVGGKVKALVGLASADMQFDRFDVNLAADRWTVTTDGRLTASNLPAAETGGSVPANEIFDFDNFDIKDLRPSGFGAAVDLGASWKVLPWLNLSASLLDLGLMHWKNDTRMTTGGEWIYTGFEEIDPTGENDFEQQIGEKLDALNALVEFTPDAGKSPLKVLPATLHFGAEANPTYWFSAGILATLRMEGIHSWKEIRGVLNVEPTHFFGFALSGAYGTFGPKLGSALNLRLPLLAIFIGTELSSPYFISSAPEGTLPLSRVLSGEESLFPRDNLNLGLTVGLNMVFGKKQLYQQQ